MPSCTETPDAIRLRTTGSAFDVKLAQLFRKGSLVKAHARVLSQLEQGGLNSQTAVLRTAVDAYRKLAPDAETRPLVFDCIRMLLERGADPAFEEGWGVLGLVTDGDVELARLFLDRITFPDEQIEDRLYVDGHHLVDHQKIEDYFDYLVLALRVPARHPSAQTRILNDAEANRNEALVRSFFEQNGAPVIALDDYPFCRSVIEALTIQQDIAESETPRPSRAVFSRACV